MRICTSLTLEKLMWPALPFAVAAPINPAVAKLIADAIPSSRDLTCEVLARLRDRDASITTKATKNGMARKLVLADGSEYQRQKVWGTVLFDGDCAERPDAVDRIRQGSFLCAEQVAHEIADLAKTLPSTDESVVLRFRDDCLLGALRILSEDHPNVQRAAEGLTVRFCASFFLTPPSKLPHDARES